MLSERGPLYLSHLFPSLCLASLQCVDTKVCPMYFTITVTLFANVLSFRWLTVLEDKTEIPEPTDTRVLVSREDSFEGYHELNSCPLGFLHMLSSFSFGASAAIYTHLYFSLLIDSIVALARWFVYDSVVRDAVRLSLRADHPRMRRSAVRWCATWDMYHC